MTEYTLNKDQTKLNHNSNSINITWLEARFFKLGKIAGYSLFNDGREVL